MHQIIFIESEDALKFFELCENRMRFHYLQTQFFVHLKLALISTRTTCSHPSSRTFTVTTVKLMATID